VPIRSYRPTSPGRRNASGYVFSEITKKKPEKALTVAKKQRAGRAGSGRISTRHRGGGAKRLIRIIDFRRDKAGVPGRVAAIEYDPGRSARIALVFYADGDKRYILAPNGLGVNQQVMAAENAPIQPGNSLPLGNIPTGTMVHCVELQPGRGGQLGRSAGVGIQLMAKDNGYALLRMPSGEMRQVLDGCRATIGVVGNAEHGQIKLGKAGRNRHRGRRRRSEVR
jgi:large subunit ribosomal protein L2